MYQYGLGNANLGYSPYRNQNFATLGANQTYQNCYKINPINSGKVVKTQGNGVNRYSTPNNYQITMRNQQLNTIPTDNTRNVGIEILNNAKGFGGKNIHKSKVQLTEQEKTYYNSLYMKLCKKNTGKIEAIDAARFIVKSGLEKSILKNIWLISSPSTDKDDYIEKEEFFVMLRLIALAQNKMPYTSESIAKNSPLPPLPNFGPAYSYQQSVNIFEIPEASKIFYQKLFEGEKEFFSSKIGAKNAIKIWRENKNFYQPDEFVIKKVVDCLKPLEEKKYLNLKEFQVACHLLLIRNKVQIPDKLPKCLSDYLGRNAQNATQTSTGFFEFLTASFRSKTSEVNRNVPTIQKNNLIKSQNVVNMNNNINQQNKLNQSIKSIQELNTKYSTINSQITSVKNQITEEQNKILKLSKQLEDLVKEQTLIQTQLVKEKQNYSQIHNSINAINVNQIKNSHVSNRKLTEDNTVNNSKIITLNDDLRGSFGIPNGNGFQMSAQGKRPYLSPVRNRDKDSISQNANIGKLFNFGYISPNRNIII